ncbi:MAG: D-2-hydroxyacid dehydrogenase [Bacteroidota bacterium]
MNSVVLDGYTLNPGDLSWEGLKKFGSLTVYDRTANSDKDILEAIGPAEAVFTNKVPLGEAVLRRAPALKYIGVLATGFNIVDVAVAKDLGITVTNVPDYSTLSVAQMTFALVLEMCHHVGAHDQAVKLGRWSSNPDFSFWDFPLIELAGKTMGIIGFGRIGQATAKLANAFGMQVLAHARNPRPELEHEQCRYTDLDGLFKQSDIISLHCPLTPETEGIINNGNIAKMKDGAMVINTARGPLVVEEDLKRALDTGKLAGAALDVASTEPIDPNNPLLTAKNCILTPHIAWAPKEARTRLMNTVVGNFQAYLDGNPINVVNL